VEARWGDNGARALVRAPADCPLTFAMNYAENLRATAVLPEGILPARAFPAYGALAGVWVPRGATEIRLEAAPTLLPFAMLWRVLGLALLVGAAVRTVAKPKTAAV